MVTDRTASQVFLHYMIERQLAKRLHRAAPHERTALYPAIYEELFRLVPDHPQLAARASPQQRDRSVTKEFAFVRRFLAPGRVFLEIGAGDGALALRAAALCGYVYAVDVAPTILCRVSSHERITVRIADSCRLPIDNDAVDVAYSNQVMEHLHPDDARMQLAEVRRVLRPGGIYVCVTPNRFSGPHDISAAFDRIATGLHLQEYAYSELWCLLRRSGFDEVRPYAGGRTTYVAVPHSAVRLLEQSIAALPGRLQWRVARLPGIRQMLGIRLSARRAP